MELNNASGSNGATAVSQTTPQIGQSPPRNEKTNLEKFFHAIAWLIIIGGIIILAYVKYSNPEFKVLSLIIIGIGIILGGLIFYYAVGIFEKFGKKDEQKEKRKGELPEPINRQEAAQLLRDYLKNTCFNYFHGTPREGTEEQGGQKIYWMYGPVLFNEEYDACFIAVNMHYPDTNLFFDPNPNANSMGNAKRRLVTKPEPEQAVEEREEHDLMTGKQVKYRKTLPQIERKEEPREDLK